MANPSVDAGKTSGGDLPSVGDAGRMSMSGYHTLTHLLEKAKREDRLGEVLHCVGFDKEVQGHIEKYQSKLFGHGAVLDPSQNDLAVQHVFPIPKAKAKSVAQKGQDLLSTIAMSSTGPSMAMGSGGPSMAIGPPGPYSGSDSTAPGGNVPLMQRFLDELSKSTFTGMAPVTEAVDNDRVMQWRAKWQPDGTCHGIRDDRSQHAAPLPPTTAQKRELEINEDEMSHEGWERIEDEVLQSMYTGTTGTPLVGVPYHVAHKLPRRCLGEPPSPGSQVSILHAATIRCLFLRSRS